MKKTMLFADALEKVLEGERVTRSEWKDEGIYGLIINGILHIRLNNKFDQWVLHEADILANDWYVI